MRHFEANYAALVQVKPLLIYCRGIETRELTFYFDFMPSMRNVGYCSFLVSLYCHYMFRHNRPSSGVQVIVMNASAARCSCLGYVA